MTKIGFSLPPDYILQEISPQENIWEQALGISPEALSRLKNEGSSTIELRKVSAGMKAEIIKQALNKITHKGLGFTVHGLLPPTDGQIGTNEGFPLWELVDDIRDMQDELIVTLHARIRPEGELTPVIADTITALRRLLEENDKRRAPFRYALEINKSKAWVDPSFTWEGVDLIVEAVAHPALGICWDFGHSYSNSRTGLIPEEPPPSFLKKVIHTHIHDINDTGDTHWPLCEENVPVARFCRLLHQAGYRGIYNLEFEPIRYPDYTHLNAALYNSVRRLEEITARNNGSKS